MPWEWDDLPKEDQENLIAYDQIRQLEEVETETARLTSLAKAMSPKVKRR